MTILRQCFFPHCRAPYRLEGEDFSLMGHLCVMCRELVRAERFAQCMLKEKEPEPPRGPSWTL